MINKDKKYRDSYYDDNCSGEEYSEYEEDYTSEEYEECNEYEEEYENEEEYCKPPHHKRYREKSPKKKHRFLWKILFKLIAFLIALLIVILSAGYVVSLFKPVHTNVLIMATDEDGTRTDTLMLASFNKKTNQVSILSIPRDTYITVSDESYALMRREYPQPGSKSMKINAVHHFGGEKHGVELLKKEVSNLLGVDINFYVKVNFEAFRYIIDSVGGIEFDVPCNMSYSDPLQNLYINLQKGTQVLNGQQAEHVLRYRSGYANADIGRISVQQNFLKAFVEQTISKGTILSHPGVYLNTLFKYDYVETDADFLDVISYAMLIGGIKTDNLQTETLPGKPAMRGGQSVYLPDMSEIANFLSIINSN